MAVVNVYEMWSRVFLERKSGFWTARKGFSVLTDSAADGADVVLSSTDLPIEGDDYESTTLSTKPRCSALKVVSRPGPFYWIVEAEYTTTGLGTFNPDDPLSMPTMVAYKTLTIEEDADSDLDGQALVTTAKQPLHGLKRERSDTLVLLKMNWATYSAGFAETLRNTLNGDPFLGVEIGSVKCNKMDASQKQKNDVVYWEVEAELQHTKWPPWVPRDSRAAGFYAWDWHVLNKGTMALDADDKPYEITDAKGKGSRTTEWLIDENGQKIDDPASQQYWLHFARYPLADFSIFGV